VKQPQARSGKAYHEMVATENAFATMAIPVCAVSVHLCIQWRLCSIRKPFVCLGRDGLDGESYII
jgi:hypothetical protein